MTERAELLAKAEQIASLIFNKLYELRHKPLKDVGLGSLLSLFKLQADMKANKDLREEDFNNPEQKIYEIILFGSVAEGKENPTDIDLMIFDNGHFSNFFPCMTSKYHMDDWREGLRKGFQWLMGGWFEVHEDQLHQILGDVEVDLHVLPLRFFKSKEFRKEVAKKHKDPNFFKNALGKAMRFDRFTRQFKPLTFGYLEKQFHCTLSDLR